MKYLIPVLGLSTACWPSVAGARSVELQDFHQSSGVPSSFVLGTPAHAADVPASQDSHTPELAAEFAAIGAGRGQHLELASPPPSHPLRIPAWMQRQAPPISFMGQTNPAEWSPSPGVLSCATDAYLPNPALPRQAEQRRALWYPAMVDAACEAGVPVNLFDALLTQESRYNPAAISPKGAAGIAQLMPDRARRLGVRNVWDPVENMRGGARYLRVLLDEFGRFDLALAAYNAGEARVRGTGRVPRIRETVNYVSEILVTMRDQFTRRLSSREALR